VFACPSPEVLQKLREKTVSALISEFISPKDKMKAGTLVSLALAVTSAFAVTNVVTFRQGVNGYSGCKSVDISDQYLANPGQWAENGMSYGDGSNDWCTGHLHGRSGYGYDISPLMRFEDLNTLIPTNAGICSANLSLRLHADGTAKLMGYYLLVDWDTGVTAAGTSSAPVGWRYRKTFSVTWSALGATGSGTDVHATKTFAFPAGEGNLVDDGSSGKVYTTALDPVEVQKWVADPANNHGFRLQVDVDNVHIAVSQCQRVTGSGRTVQELPLLSVEYSTDGTCGSGSGSGSSGTSGGSSGTSGTSGTSGGSSGTSGTSGTSGGTSGTSGTSNPTANPDTANTTTTSAPTKKIGQSVTPSVFITLLSAMFAMWLKLQ
jgi:hypothetical protein